MSKITKKSGKATMPPWRDIAALERAVDVLARAMASAQDTGYDSETLMRWAVDEMVKDCHVHTVDRARLRLIASFGGNDPGLSKSDATAYSVQCTCLVIGIHQDWLATEEGAAFTKHQKRLAPYFNRNAAEVAKNASNGGAA